MKIKVNLKIILVVLTIVTLFVIPTYVFAADDLKDFFNTGWEDLTGEDGTDGTGTDGAGANGAGTDGAGANKNQNNNKKPESYDKAGIAEDTMMVIAVITLIMIAICAYNKVNEYKGI